MSCKFGEYLNKIWLVFMFWESLKKISRECCPGKHSRLRQILFQIYALLFLGIQQTHSNRDLNLRQIFFFNKTLLVYLVWELYTYLRPVYLHNKIHVNSCHKWLEKKIPDDHTKKIIIIIHQIASPLTESESRDDGWWIPYLRKSKSHLYHLLHIHHTYVDSKIQASLLYSLFL